MKKKVLCALMSGAMVWSALAVPAFAATDIPNSDAAAADQKNGTHGAMDILGEVNTKEHKEHFRVAVPTDKALGFKFVADPEKNGEYANMINNTAYSLYFKKDAATQSWMGVQLPGAAVQVGRSRLFLDNRSNYLVMSNIGSQDVNVKVSVDAVSGNSESKLDAGLEVWARNPLTVADANTAGTNGWQRVFVRGEKEVDTNNNVIVGTVAPNGDNFANKDEENATGNLNSNGWNPDQNDVYGAMGWTNNGVLLSVNSDETISGTDATAANVKELSVRLVRAGGHIPDGEAPNGQVTDGTVKADGTPANLIWGVEDQRTYFDDALNKNTKLDKATLDAVSSVAFQVTGETWGKGWSDNSYSAIKVTWNVTSANTHAAAINENEKKQVINTSSESFAPITVKGTVGEGTLKAISIEGVYWRYSTDGTQMKIDGTSYCNAQIKSDGTFEVTLTSEALKNLAKADAGENGFYLPAYMKVVFNVEGGGTTEDYFWVLGN